MNQNRAPAFCFDASSSREPASTPHQVRGRLSLENALKLYALGRFERASVWSTVCRLSEDPRDNGRCRRDLSSGNSANAVRRSGLESWSARPRPPLPFPRFFPIAPAPRPAPPAPEGDWDLSTGLRAPRTATHHIVPEGSG